MVPQFPSRLLQGLQGSPGVFGRSLLFGPHGHSHGGHGAGCGRKFGNSQGNSQRRRLWNSRKSAALRERGGRRGSGGAADSAPVECGEFWEFGGFWEFRHRLLQAAPGERAAGGADPEGIPGHAPKSRE